MKYYQPKGSMCIACEKLNDDCSKLDFGEMKKIGIYTDNHGKTITIVKCNLFKHKQNGVKK